MDKKNILRSGYDAKQDRQLRALLTTQEDIWRVFHIMAEFVEGFTMMSKQNNLVSIFGSARLKSNSRYYKLAVQVARELVKQGFNVLTGGGPGIMEAANRGAQEQKGDSVGVAIKLPEEQNVNQFIDRDRVQIFQHFFVRKVMFVKYAHGFVVLPGGFGTLDELFEAITLVKQKMILPNDIDIFYITDDPVKAAKIIAEFYKKHHIVTNF
jgi:uncharacterized protein (TIGR00730 family)